MHLRLNIDSIEKSAAQHASGSSLTDDSQQNSYLLWKRGRGILKLCPCIVDYINKRADRQRCMLRSIFTNEVYTVYVHNRIFTCNVSEKGYYYDCSCRIH